MTSPREDSNGYSVTEAAGFRLGDFVRWADGEGSIEHLMAEGVLGVPGGPFAIEASRESPAALIRIHRNGEPTELLIGKPVSVLSRVGVGVRLGRNGRR